MQQKSRTLAARIERLFDTLSPELQSAARWLLANQQQASVVSMRRCAVMAGVSAPTMTRLAKALGETGFAALQAQLSATTLSLAKQQLGQPWASHAPHAYESNARIAKSNAQWLQDVRASHIGNVASVAHAVDAPIWQALGVRLLQARRLVCLGVRASFSVAQQLHYASSLLRPNVDLLHTSGGEADVLCELDGRDVLVVVSQAPYAQLALESAQQAKRQGLYVVAVTDSSVSPFAQMADHAVVFEAQSVSFFPSMLGSLSAIEIMLGAMAVAAEPHHLQHLAKRERYLRERQAYVLSAKDSAGFLQITPSHDHANDQLNSGRNV